LDIVLEKGSRTNLIDSSEGHDQHRDEEVRHGLGPI
jgi:hypothetical protein